MKCTNCGVNIGNEAQFCPYCGQTVQTTPNNDVNLNPGVNSQNQNEFSSGAFPSAPVAPDVGPIVLPVQEGGIGNNPLFQSTQFNVASPTPNTDGQVDTASTSDFDNPNTAANVEEQEASNAQETPVTQEITPEVPVGVNNSKNHTTLIIVIIVMLLCGIAFIGFTIFTNWK